MTCTYYQALNYQRLSKVIEALPRSYWKILNYCIQCKKKQKLDPSTRDFLRGEYLSGCGKIVIYGFTKEEVANFEYVDIIYHEIGHKIFQEFLTRKEKAKWAAVRKTKFPIKLDDVYLYEELWEEEFCIVFSLIMAAEFFRRNKMSVKAKKIDRGLKQINKEAKVVQQLVKSASVHEKKKGSTKEAYPQRIHRRVLNWIERQ